MNNIFDISILGGGPAGCATALALCQRTGLTVQVVESGTYRNPRIGESIPPDTRGLLQRLQLWDDFTGEPHDACFGSCSSWGSDELGYNDFLFNPNGNGWHLDRRRFNSQLAHKAAEAGAVINTGTRFHGYRQLQHGGFELKLRPADGGHITTRSQFVVDATGIRCSFARRLGASREMLDQLVCVSGFFQLPDELEFPKLTLLEAVENGWWYAARLPGNRAIAAFAGDAHSVKQEGLQTTEGWLNLLQQTRYLAERLPSAQLMENELWVRPAPSFVLDKITGDHWLAVGDAASAYDPLSSQGIYKALATGLEAADAITGHLQVNAPDALNAYQAAIKARFQEFRDQRQYFYQAENRWPSAPFWAQRQQL